MPTYTYECKNGHYTRIIQHMREPRPDSLPCTTCECRASRIFRAPQINSFEPYVTFIGDSQRKVVRNSAEAADIEKKFQVAEITSEELKKRSDIGDMRSRRAKRDAEAKSALRPMKEDFEAAHAEVKTWGKEFHKQWERDERHKYESFQREVEAGRVND